jgi:hypothetical protein
VYMVCLSLQTVTSAVKAPANLLSKSESSLSRGPGAPTNPIGSLLSAPTGWLFGGGKQKQQQDLLKSAAFGRLANVDLTAVRAPPAKPLSILVAGFTADEAASELLPHFLDFAPANRLVGEVCDVVCCAGRLSNINKHKHQPLG